MTRYDAGHRLLDDIEKSHERALAKLEMQIRVMGGYRDELEDKLEIAVELLVGTFHYGKDEAGERIDWAYAARQAARKVAVEESVSSEYLTGDALANTALAHIVSEYGLKQPQEDAS